MRWWSALRRSVEKDIRLLAWSPCYSARKFDADRHANPLRYLDSRGQICAPNNNPTMAWVAQQIREAFPWDTAPRYLIRDRDGAYGQSFRSTGTAIGVEEVVTAPRSPWQNPYVERLIGSVRRKCPGPFDHPQRAAFAAHSWLIPRLLSRFKDPPVDRQGHTGWTTRSAGRVRNGRFLAQGRRSASSLRTPRGLTTPARIRSIPLCGDVDAADIRMPLHSFAGMIRRNKHRDDRAHGRLQNPLAQNDVRAGEPSRRWEARWNKWKGQLYSAPRNAWINHG